MALASISLGSEAAFCAVAHALSTERQEVMGLLFGRWAPAEGRGWRALVESAQPLSRSDRRADRVEVTAPQLAAAAEAAERQGRRVVGWYHSHPHITAAASAVDVRTQARVRRDVSGRTFLDERRGLASSENGRSH